MSVRDLKFKRGRGWRFWLPASFGLLLVIALGGAFAVKSWLAGGQPKDGGLLVADVFDSPAEIRRDADGLIAIRADTRLDAYRALGVAHAQDRLFQMELMRRSGSGRLAEVLGPIGPLLRFDKLMRTLGMRQKAEADWAAAGPDLRAVATAYAEGVNAFLAGRDGPLPLEFQLLQLEPEPWRPVDSMIWAQIMALQLSGNWGREAQRARLLKAVDAETIEKMFPAPPPGSPVTLPPSVRAGRATAQADAPISEPFDAETAIARVVAAFDALPRYFTPPGASNAWALDGTQTASGKPILANDPHLGFQAPILWHLVRMEAPGLTLVGATTPGVPLMIIGHNGFAAWGFTTTHSDTQDFVIEKTDPTDPRAYLTPDGPRLFDLRRETIKVRWNDPIELDVRATRHGPIVSDIDERAAEVVAPYRESADDALQIALAWPALSEPNGVADALLAANGARSWPAFRDAFRRAGAPQQNIFYADVDGRIGFIAPALVPLRDGYDGRWPVAGWTRDRLWTGFAPFDALPQAVDPPEGRIVNANNAVLGPDDALLLSTDLQQAWRAERILNMLDASSPGHSADDSARIQLDTLSLYAQRAMPAMISAARSGGAQDPRAAAVLDRMNGWDGDMLAAAPEPAIFAAWLQALHGALFAERLGDGYESFDAPAYGVILQALRGEGGWCAAGCASEAAAALDAALVELDDRFSTDAVEDWRWGALHSATFSHPVFDQIPVIRGLLGGPTVETGGGYHTVNRGGYIDGGPRAYRHVHGPGLRAVFDLADLDRARFMIGTGQSGDPLSAHFDDMAARWRDGDWVDLAPSRFTDADVFLIAPE